MGQWGGAQGLPKFTKISKTCLHCDVTSRKPHRKRKTFFSMSTRRLAESVEGLNSSLALATGDLWPKKGRPIAAVKGLKAREKYWNSPAIQDSCPNKFSRISSILLAILCLERLMSSNRRACLSGTIIFATSCIQSLTNSPSVNGQAERAIFSAITYDAIADFSVRSTTFLNVFCCADRELCNFSTKSSLDLPTNPAYFASCKV